MTNGVITTFSLRPEQIEAFDRIARLRGTNRSALMRDVLDRYIATQHTPDLAPVKKIVGSQGSAPRTTSEKS